MKKLLPATALALALTLAACSGAQVAHSESEAPPVASEPSLSSDPLMAEAEELPPPEGSLSTPVEPPPALEVPPMPDLATSTEASTSTATQTATESSVSMPPSIAPPASKSEALPPVVAGPGATNADRNAYQDYREYQDRVKTRGQSESELEARTLFPHEDGAFQFGFDYIHGAFSNYDFDSGVAVKSGESQGAAIHFSYFPIRSLSYGRLGIGAQVAAYWTKYDHNGGGAPDTTNMHSFDTIGLRAIYEFDYLLGQILVPFGFYGYEQVRPRALRGLNNSKNRFNTSIYGGGLNFNLNRLESDAASKALATSGIRKFYLSYTYLQQSENTGASHYLGLKFEY